MFCTVLLHLFVNFLGQQISRQKLICETLHVLSVELCALSPNGFRDQKASGLIILGIECGRVNLHVVDVLQFNSVANCNRQCIAGEMTEVGGMAINSADSAGGQYGAVRLNGLQGAVFLPNHRAVAGVVLCNQILHGGVFHQLDVRKFFYLCQKLAGNFLAGDVLVKEDSFIRVGALPGEIQFAVLVPVETNAVLQEILNHVLRGTDHDVHGLPVVLVVSRFHGIFKIAVVVLVVLQHADSALCQVGIVAFQIGFGNQCDFLVSRELQCTVQSGAAAADD